MNKSILVSTLGVVAAVLGLATFSGDASAYTRSVCGLTATLDNPANWAAGNCAIKNVSGGVATARFSIPLDSGSDVSARAFLEGSASSTGTVQLITFNDTFYYRIGVTQPTVGGSVTNQAVYTSSLNMVGTTGTATLIVSVQPNNYIYDAMIWN